MSGGAGGAPSPGEPVTSTTNPVAATAAPKGIEMLKHLIFVVQENRSFDHYFGTFPGANGITMKGGKPSVCIPDSVLDRCSRPYHDESLVDLGGPHSHFDSVEAVNDGRMDGFIDAVVDTPNPCANDRFSHRPTSARYSRRRPPCIGPMRQTERRRW